MYEQVDGGEGGVAVSDPTYTWSRRRRRRRTREHLSTEAYEFLIELYKCCTLLRQQRLVHFV